MRVFLGFRYGFVQTSIAQISNSRLYFVQILLNFRCKFVQFSVLSFVLSDSVSCMPFWNSDAISCTFSAAQVQNSDFVSCTVLLSFLSARSFPIWGQDNLKGSNLVLFIWACSLSALSLCFFSFVQIPFTETHMSLVHMFRPYRKQLLPQILPFVFARKQVGFFPFSSARK